MCFYISFSIKRCANTHGYIKVHVFVIVPETHISMQLIVFILLLYPTFPSFKYVKTHGSYEVKPYFRRRA